MITRFISIALITVMPICSVYADELDSGELKFITGLDISSGDYGETSSTDIFYFPLTLKYSSLPWSFKLTLPYLSIQGPGTLVGGLDGVEMVNSDSNERTTSSGPGDIVFGAAWALDTLWNSAPYVDLVGKLKIPTADESAGLGTGELDYQLQIDIADVYGKFTPLATLGYKIPGDTESTDYRNQFLASLGFDYKLNDVNNSGLIFDFREASTDNSDDRRELLGYVNWKVSPRLSLNTYLVAGFGNASPDLGGGVQFTFKQ